MAAIINVTCALLFLGLIVQGNRQCEGPNDIKISQTSTGALVEKKMEWQATVLNDCDCSQTSIKLSCDAFHSVKEIDPSVLEQAGGVCLLNGPLEAHQSVSFTYAWDFEYPFEPLFSTVECPTGNV